MNTTPAALLRPDRRRPILTPVLAPESLTSDDRRSLRILRDHLRSHGLDCDVTIRPVRGRHSGYRVAVTRGRVTACTAVHADRRDAWAESFARDFVAELAEVA